MRWTPSALLPSSFLLICCLVNSSEICPSGHEFDPEVSKCRQCSESYYSPNPSLNCSSCPQGRGNIGEGNNECSLVVSKLTQQGAVIVAALCGVIFLSSFVYFTQQGGSFAIFVADICVVAALVTNAFYVSSHLFVDSHTMYAALAALASPHVMLCGILFWQTKWRKVLVYCGPLQEHRLLSEHHGWIYSPKFKFNFLPSAVPLLIFVSLWPGIRVLYTLAVVIFCFCLQLLQLIYGWTLCISCLFSDRHMNSLFWKLWTASCDVDETTFTNDRSRNILAVILTVWTLFGFFPLFVIQVYNNRVVGWSAIAKLSATVSVLVIALTLGHLYFAFRRRFPDLCVYEIRSEVAGNSESVAVEDRPITPTSLSALSRGNSFSTRPNVVVPTEGETNSDAAPPAVIYRGLYNPTIY